MSVMDIPPKKPGSTWSDAAHREAFLGYVVDGLSATETATRLAERTREKCTRNMVLAYADRNNWPHKPAPSKQLSTKMESPHGYRPKYQAPGAKSAPLRDLDPRSLDGALLESSCKFPVGKSPPRHDMSEHLFCGERATDGSYCHRHANIAYPPGKRKETS